MTEVPSIPRTWLQEQEFPKKPEPTIEVDGKMYPSNAQMEDYTISVMQWGCEQNYILGEVVRHTTLGQQRAKVPRKCKELLGR